MTLQLCLIGTGLMGRPMSENLLKAGYPLAVWNRTIDKARPLADMGARLATSPADAADGADLVITMLENGAVVGDVLFEQGVTDALRPGSLVVDSSSIPPAQARTHAARLAAKGIGHVDAPVSGGTRGAAEATLAIMAGGTPADFARAREVLAVMGRPTHVGPAGAGQMAKCTNQVIVAITIGAVAEGLLLAEAGGANPEAVREAILGGFADSRILQEHGRRMLERNFVPGGPARLQLKDLETALAAVAETAPNLPLTQRVRDLFRDLADAGGGNYDHSALLVGLEGLNPGVRVGRDEDRF